MRTEELVTWIRIITEDDSAYVLEYYIYKENAYVAPSYGLLIRQTERTIESCVTRALFADKNQAVELACQYAKNFVFPCSLPDLIYDYELMYQR